MDDVEEKVGKQAGEMVVKALKLLEKYPLCDRCLGRMFALLGRGLTNEERGRALKTIIVQSLHALIREGDDEALELFKRIAPNVGGPASRLYRELMGRDLEPKECFICGSRLYDIIERAATDALKELSKMRVSTFIVAAHVPNEIIERENQLKILFGLHYAESIKAEIRREVSKRLQLHGFKPDFDSPDVVVNVYLDPYRVTIDVMPLLIACKYKKLGRRVSQSTWITVDGLKYPFAVELALTPLADLLSGSRVVLHAAGREDADVRMLGAGRPCVAEIKEARVRYFDLEELNSIVRKSSGGLVDITFIGRAMRKDVRRIKEEAEKHIKVYKALVVVERNVEEHDIAKLEQFFQRRVVRQRTPRRVRHRRADVVREKIVYEVKAKRLAGNVIEALIVADAGLYIKELVDGDDGDTSPSFAELLGSRAYCAELDVVYISPQYPGPARGKHG